MFWVRSSDKEVRMAYNPQTDSNALTHTERLEKTYITAKTTNTHIPYIQTHIYSLETTHTNSLPLTRAGTHIYKRTHVYM